MPRLASDHTTSSQVDHRRVCEYLKAANYLDIAPLMDILVEGLANQIKDKTPEEIRQHFGIENDFTPEQEAKALSEIEWVNNE